MKYMDSATFDNLRKVNSIHLLRGIIIILIVICHCYGILWSSGICKKMGSNQSYFYFFSSLTLNWTVGFVLIAGYLFQHLSYKFKLKRYYLSKIKNVIIPYTVVSFVIFVFCYWDYINDNSIYQSFKKFFIEWKRGSLSIPFWFIPMITVIYLLAPILKFLSGKNLTTLSIISFIFVSLYPRPHDGYKLLSISLHFLPVYIIGMGIRQNHLNIMKIIKRNFFIIIMFFSVVLLLIATMYETIPNFSLRGVMYTPFKIMIFMLLLYFWDYTNSNFTKNKFNSILSYIANISFPIFFIHYAILESIFYLFLKNNNYFQQVTQNCSGFLELIIGITMALITLFLSIIVIEVVKKMTKNKSRYFIGC
ncbi:hypothetical protein DKK78_04130 [Gilliamella apis]|uniref:Acyltransferase 3 domain-containing protein n=2 Tax=Orbaceae TaxID=1240483 RepID=A0A2V4DVI6_9GAMM|nr:hypothetical protein DKK78_04130 [Gilliamella apis]